MLAVYLDASFSPASFLIFAFIAVLFVTRILSTRPENGKSTSLAVPYWIPYLGNLISL
jgi:hypothetical protein